MDSISVNGLKLRAYHGVGEQERRVGNDFEVSVTVYLPGESRAAVSDALDDTVNYAEIAEIVRREMAMPSKLIEHVAYRIRQAICAAYGSRICGGKVTVEKLAPPIPAQLQSVAFSTEWGQN